ncbi:SPFH domain-containing protein [candidate division CSSED10-310 bacterium]|uniref:SPFH domain-containing protein n=1 Tax=candidate division CSSED10-310 bacterium TaxID=2855610 RepID=A0ABV6YZC0_UNCC1
MLYSLGFFLFVALFIFISGIRVIKNGEVGVVFRMGKVLPDPRQPGLNIIIAFTDKLIKIGVEPDHLDIPTFTSDSGENTQLTVTASFDYQVIDPIKAICNVENYQQATILVAQKSIENVLGNLSYTDWRKDKAKITDRIRSDINDKTLSWGIDIRELMFKDVAVK